MNLGLVGIGRMGRPICGRLLEAGFEVHLHDVLDLSGDPLIQRGATLVHSVRELAACDAVLVCVPGPREVETVLLGDDGLLASGTKGQLVIDLSTIGCGLGDRIAADARARGIAFVDAPVSGGVQGAQDGRLTATVGGEAFDIERARPVLGSFCREIYHVGPGGTGYLAKAINQIIYLSYIASFTEAVALGAKGGLDVAVLVSALRSSVAGSPLSTRWEERLITGDTAPGFAMHRALKDLEVGAEACRLNHFEAPLFQNTLKLFRVHNVAGFAEADVTALFSSQKAR